MFDVYVHVYYIYIYIYVIWRRLSGVLEALLSYYHHYHYYHCYYHLSLLFVLLCCVLEAPALFAAVYIIIIIICIIIICVTMLSPGSPGPIACCLYAYHCLCYYVVGKLKTIMWCVDCWLFSNQVIVCFICSHSNTITWLEKWLTTITSHKRFNFPITIHIRIYICIYIYIYTYIHIYVESWKPRPYCLLLTCLSLFALLCCWKTENYHVMWWLLAVFQSGDCLFHMLSFKYNHLMRKMIDDNHIT